MATTPDPYANFMIELQRDIDEFAGGNVAEAARQIGIPQQTLYSIFDRSSDAKPKTRSKIRAWQYASRQAVTAPVTAPEPNVHREDQAVPSPSSQSPRQRAIHLIESLDDHQVPAILRALRLLIATAWEKENAEDTADDE